jgi:hypothetical protein
MSSEQPQSNPADAPAPQYAQPPVGRPYSPPPGQPYAQGPVGPGTNVLAILSLIFSGLGMLLILPVIGSIAGVVMGHLANRQIPTTGEQGAGLAKAGLIVGYIGLGLTALVVVGYILFLVVVVASSGTGY